MVEDFTDLVTFARGSLVTSAENAANAIIELEKTIAQAQWSRVQSRDATKSYNKMTVAEANELMGEFDLSAYFEAVGVDAQELIVRQPSYFEAFAGIFKNTDLTVWQNYLKFHFLFGKGLFKKENY